jgi:hypothetical protein
VSKRIEPATCANTNTLRSRWRLTPAVSERGSFFFCCFPALANGDKDFAIQKYKLLVLNPNTTMLCGVDKIQSALRPASFSPPCSFISGIGYTQTMAESIQPPDRKNPAPRMGWLLVGAALALAAATLIVWLATGIGLWRWAEVLRGDRSIIHPDQPTVVRQIQQLQRLETVRYSMEKIISGEHDSPYLPKFLVSDRLLLVVHGEVIAGVDLRKIEPSDVSIHGRSVTVHLPRSEILVVRLDNSKTRVYSRDTGLFSSPDPNLESEVREEAERQLQQAALQDGVLKSAEENARTALAAILKGLGFEQIDFS